MTNKKLSKKLNNIPHTHTNDNLVQSEHLRLVLWILDNGYMHNKLYVQPRQILV
jgi:hypothetical protein